MLYFVISTNATSVFILKEVTTSMNKQRKLHNSHKLSSWRVSLVSSRASRRWWSDKSFEKHLRCMQSVCEEVTVSRFRELINISSQICVVDALTQSRCILRVAACVHAAPQMTDICPINQSLSVFGDVCACIWCYTSARWWVLVLC